MLTGPATRTVGVVDAHQVDDALLHHEEDLFALQLLALFCKYEGQWRNDDSESWQVLPSLAILRQ